MFWEVLPLPFASLWRLRLALAHAFVPWECLRDELCPRKGWRTHMCTWMVASMCVFGGSGDFVCVFGVVGAPPCVLGVSLVALAHLLVPLKGICST